MTTKKKLVVRRKPKKKSKAKVEAQPISIRTSGTSGIYVELSEYRGAMGISIARCGLDNNGTPTKFYKRMFFSLAETLEKEHGELPTSIAEELIFAMLGLVSFHQNNN